MKIFVSGLYCGANPQPGVGMIRSLRDAFPNAIIVGVEYSTRVSGIHWHGIDELWIDRPWEELDLASHGERIKLALSTGGLWLSGSDLEAMWLADVFPSGHPHLLAPGMNAFRQIIKPAVSGARNLPIKIPDYISTEHSDWDLHAFCREQNWNVWLKGPYYDASRTPSWETFEYVRAALSKVWSTERLFLQKHVSGYEESIMLSAYRGTLLGAVRMQKRDVTPEGKTWAGEISEVPDEFMIPLRAMVKSLDWTGGGELEMVRDASDQAWLLEMNPRFPAWVHGATIAGYNLPGLLVEAASGFKAKVSSAISNEFTRVVLEIPVRDRYPLPPLPEPFANAAGHSVKHPSGLTSLAKKLHKMNPGMLEAVPDPGAPDGLPTVPSSFIDDIDSHDFATIETPQFLFLNSTATRLFRAAAVRMEALSSDELKIVTGYSIKTNPDARLMRLALNHGFMAEAIGLLEVRKALEVGFRADQIILNGPGKWWPEGMMPKDKMHAVFCDSVADLERVLSALADGSMSTAHVGVRIRPPNIVSRFGIPVDSPAAFAKLVKVVKRLPIETAFGVHFHMASANIGVAQWWHLLESILRWCSSIEALTSRKVELLDMGGGWFPDDWHADDSARFSDAIKRIRSLLPHVTQIVSEPGKAMAQPSMALATRILEIQEHDDDYVEAVVDASIAELPMYFFYPHRMLRKCGVTGAMTPLGRGKTHLMGRLCMEHDVVAANVSLPAGTQAGDLLIFCDAGGYDRSMSYVFGRG